MSHRRPGFVLVVVLVVIALMTLAALSFSKLMVTERGAARMSNRQAQARALAESGIDSARVFLCQDVETQKNLGGWYDNPNRFRATTVRDDASPAECGHFSLVAPRLEGGLPSGVRYGLENESGKININLLVQLDTSNSGMGRQVLMMLPGMTEEIADAILDWLDSDDTPREFGVESDYYAGLSPGYAPRNGPIESLEELLLVRGVTPALLFGADVNRNGLLDAGESGDVQMGDADNSDGSMNAGWAAHLTIYSYEANTQADGTAKINVNQGNDAQTLYTQLQEALGNDDWAKFIILYRQYGAAQQNQTPPSNNPTPSVQTGSISAIQIDQTKTMGTQVSSLFDLIGASVEVTQTQGRNTSTIRVPSPFAADLGSMGSWLPTLLDKLTTSSDKTIPGRININVASRTVLLSIPNMTAEIADAIIAQRTSNPADDSSDRLNESWVVVEGLVPPELAKPLLPLITTKGSVYRLQSVGFFDAGGPSARIEAIIDSTSRPPRVLFWREMTHLGRGYAPDVLGVGG